MAVVDIVNKVDGKGGGWTLEQAFTLTASVYVIMDSADTDPEAILRSLGLNPGDTYRYPLIGTPVATNPRLFLQSVGIDSVDEDGLGAHVTAAFAPANPEKDDRGPVDEDGFRNPFDAPPKLRWATEFEDFALTHDKSAQPILNKAGDPFDPPITVPISTPVAVVTRVEREFNAAWVNDFKGRINSAEWLGWPAGSVLYRDITSDREWSDDVGGFVWPTEYQFAFRPPIEVSSTKIYPGWSVQVLNAGLREKVSGAPNRNILDDTGAPVSAPVALKNDGTKAGPSDDPVFLTFDVYPEVDFAGLGMPSDLFTAGTPEA